MWNKCQWYNYCLNVHNIIWAILLHLKAFNCIAFWKYSCLMYCRDPKYWTDLISNSYQKRYHFKVVHFNRKDTSIKGTLKLYTMTPLKKAIYFITDHDNLLTRPTKITTIFIHKETWPRILFKRICSISKLLIVNLVPVRGS